MKKAISWENKGQYKKETYLQFMQWIEKSSICARTLELMFCLTRFATDLDLICLTYERKLAITLLSSRRFSKQFTVFRIHSFLNIFLEISLETSEVIFTTTLYLIQIKYSIIFLTQYLFKAMKHNYVFLKSYIFIYL